MSSDLPPRSARVRPLVWLVVLAVAAGFLLGAVVLWLLGPQLGRDPKLVGLDPAAAARAPDPRSPLDADEQEAVAVFKTARESVVNVDTVTLVRNRLDMRVQEQQTGTGSGFAWDDDGRIVTNNHVVREVTAGRGIGLRVVLADKSSWSAAIVGVDPDHDLAVLQLDPAAKGKLKKIKVGTSKDLEVGQKAYAIGNPFGLALTMTKGIISALDREIDSLTDRPITGAIQTDAPINPGNSGGPLLDKDGRLIGVNSSIATPSGGNVGIGFAIPVDTVNDVVTELIRTGRVLQPDAGITLVDQRRLRRAGFATGVMVGRVDPNGPAAKAGLKGLSTDADGDAVPGDLIVAVDGEEVKGSTEFARIISRHRMGDKVKLTIERGGSRSEVELTLRGV